MKRFHELVDVVVHVFALSARILDFFSWVDSARAADYSFEPADV
jgi:hypothetical protein